jgi:hypothetical protein
MARECAQIAHAALVAEGVLSPGDCADASDLSAVADAVWAKTGQQTPVVKHLPLSKFRRSEPNRGYLAAAALLRERALAGVLTLNYDLTIHHGLMTLSSASSVEELAGPQDHYRLSVTNVIYLHRNVEVDPEEWVIRSVVLEEGWREGWEEMIASAVLVTPITVFVGLGSRAAVLVESAERIRHAIKDGVEIYQADPAAYGNSEFTAAIGIEQHHYVQMGWSEFMVELGLTLLDEHLSQVVASADQLADREHFARELVVDDTTRLRPEGLVGVGRMRAAWFLDDHNYVPWHQANHEWTADILLGVALIERITGTTARFLDNGLIELDRASALIASTLIAHGTGRYRWGSLQTRVRFQMTRRLTVATAPKAALLFGHVGPQPATSLPDDLLGDADPSDLVFGPSLVRFYSIEDLRANEALVNVLAS